MKTMLRFLTDIHEIIKKQEQFEIFLRNCKDVVKEACVKRPGKKYSPETVYWNKEHQIYYRLGKHTLTSRPIYWNVFGISSNEIVTGHCYEIVVEINFPYEKRTGRGRPLAGRIAIDDNKRVYILHDGSIHQGNLFKKYPDYYQGPTIEVNERDKIRSFALCSVSNGKDIVSLKMISDFVHEIKKVKEKIRSRT